MLILIRFLPYIVGITNVALFLFQARFPSVYPWVIVPAPLLLIGASVLIVWRRRRGAEDARLILPSVIALIVAGYGLLLAEGVLALWVIPFAAGIVSLLVLELLFLLTYLSARYPVNGISHVNLTLVPFILWLTAYTSVGLTVFVNSSRFIPIISITLVSCLLFYATSHVESGRPMRIRWAVLGAWIGMHIGVLGAVLPLDLHVHGSLAALLTAFVLRARRYGILPQLPIKLMVVESFGCIVLLILLLASSAWA